jgi:glycosyltransferase involved in cell wall biosynthesis
MENKVKTLIEEGNFDAILAFEFSSIQYCPPSCFHKLIVNIEDPQSIKLNRMRKLPIWSLWQKVKLTVNAKLTERHEEKLLHRMAKVILLSESDMRDMYSIRKLGNLTYMPYGVELKNASESINYEEREKTIIFSGNMYHPPNVDGALYFLKDIFPLVLEEYPLAVLWIVGSNPDNRIHKEAAKYGKQVVITGTVEDITVYIKSATVSICPVRLKIGVQTKLLEALSLGTPVVTTNAGNSGIGGKSGVHLWAEDRPQQFALRVISLLNGHDWEKLSNEGRKLVSEHFTWETNVAEFEHYLESLITLNK